MTPDGKPLFIDTNVLIFANVREAAHHEHALGRIKECKAAGCDFWVSAQVLREFLAVRSRTDLFREPGSPSVLQERIRYSRSRFRVATDSDAVIDKLLMLLGQVQVSGKQVHDANIVATMIVHDIRHLLTDNVDDFRRFERFVEVVPLVE